MIHERCEQLMSSISTSYALLEFSTKRYWASLDASPSKSFKHCSNSKHFIGKIDLICQMKRVFIRRAMFCNDFERFLHDFFPGKWSWVGFSDELFLDSVYLKMVARQELNNHYQWPICRSIEEHPIKKHSMPVITLSRALRDLEIRDQYDSSLQ